MRLVHFLVGTQEGGAEEFFMKLIIAQHEAGDELLVILGPNTARLARLDAAGVNYLALEFGGFLTDWKSRRTMQAALQEFRPHIVQCWMSRAARRMKPGPWVSVGRQGGYYPVKHYKVCDHLVANTPAIVDYIRRDGWPESRVHLLSNFGSLAACAPVQRRDLGTPESARVVLAMGRLTPSKGFDILIEAMAKLDPGTYLWLAGVGEDENQLRQLAADLGLSKRVKLLGWRDDASALFAEADVYVLSSRDEPLGNVVLEAWQAGVPVVAAKSPGPCWIIEDRKDGLLVNNENPDAMAEAIREVCDDEALSRSLVQQARHSYEERFSKQTILAQYREFYTLAWQQKFGSEIIGNDHPSV
jgi:glycosyltransferase involved in cell wall biosynthesis